MPIRPGNPVVRPYAYAGMSDVQNENEAFNPFAPIKSFFDFLLAPFKQLFEKKPIEEEKKPVDDKEKPKTRPYYTLDGIRGLFRVYKPKALLIYRKKDWYQSKTFYDIYTVVTTYNVSDYELQISQLEYVYYWQKGGEHIKLVSPGFMIQPRSMPGSHLCRTDYFMPEYDKVIPLAHPEVFTSYEKALNDFEAQIREFYQAVPGAKDRSNELRYGIRTPELNDDVQEFTIPLDVSRNFLIDLDMREVRASESDGYWNPVGEYTIVKGNGPTHVPANYLEQ